LQKKLSKRQFRITKIRETLAKIIRNKRALFGIIILIIYGSLAVFAPLLTPYDPIRDKALSMPLSMPLWYANFLQIPHSENVLPISDSYLDSPSALPEWTINHSSTVNISWINFTGFTREIDTLVRGPQEHRKAGCFLINLTGFPENQTEATLTLTARPFIYSYPIAPQRFKVVLLYLAKKVELAPARMFVYIGQNTVESMTDDFVGVGNEVIRTFQLSKQNIKENSETIYLDGLPLQKPKDYAIFYNNGTIVFSKPPGRNVNATANYKFYNRYLIYDSNREEKPLSETTIEWNQLLADSQSSTEKFKVRYFGDVMADPASIVFSKKPGNYTVVFQLVFQKKGNYTGGTAVFLDNLYVKLYGNAFGSLGTDTYGSDLFCQLVFGAQISLFIGLLAAFVSVVLGLTVGLLAGYVGGLTDEILMRFTDILLVLPGLPLILVMMVVLGASMWNLIILLGFLGWMGFARTVRSMVLSLRERPFIESAKAAGAGTGYIISKHVIPNVMTVVYVTLATSVPAAILSEAALSFLGLGDPLHISWGKTLYYAETSQGWKQWFCVLPPGLSIALVSLSFILFGFALDDILNPRLRARK